MNRTELAEQIQSLLEGSIAAQDRAQLEAALASDEAIRVLYLDSVDIHNLLGQQSEHPTSPGQIIPMNRVVARQKRRSLRRAVFAAAAVVIFALGILTLVTLPESPLARFTTAPQSHVVITHSTPEGEDPPEDGELAAGSRLRLIRGAIQVRFASGVESIIRAPADLTLREENLVALKYGTGWFEVPERAIGFQVDTPEFLLTDLGTEFGVVSEPTTPDQVHVIRGSVEVRNHRGATWSQTLVAREARSALPDGGWEEIPFSTDDFLDYLPDTPYLRPAAKALLTQIVAPTRNGFTGTVGIRFTPTEALSVTALGFQDAGGDGLSTNHVVALWTVDGIPVASVTVRSGTAATLDSHWRYENLSPVTLEAGQEYFLGAFVSRDDGDLWTDAEESPGVSTSTGATVEANAFSHGTLRNSLTDGTQHNLRWAPANMRYLKTSGVPPGDR